MKDALPPTSTSSRIGFLGGTFDPPHFGHLHLAIELMERCGLDEVWFCPAQANPLKQEPVATALQRLQMVQFAVEEIPGLKVIDLELTRPSPSYTIDTIKTLCNTQSNHTFHLLLGDDAVNTFYLWKDVEELVHLAPPLVGLRSRHLKPFLGSQIVIDALQRGMVSMPVIEITATEIRNRLENHHTCIHLIPAKVLDFIATHQLY